MSALAPWLFLVGLVVVPVALLLVGARMHRRPARLQTAFRGAAIGFLVALVIVLGLLVLPPFHWPPGAASRLWAMAFALPALTGLGAVAGHVAHRE